ncbi:hypothetical protein GJAV_G00195490 [Gymnothorax javanicus]|nr:hypothetical protein GJAV_G00195490 [Gymnothorax javanicus]
MACYGGPMDFGYVWMETCQPSAFECLMFSAEPVNGRTYTMYHGTSKEAARQILACGFRQSSGGMLGRGVYISRDLQKASKYPLGIPASERVVLKLRVRVGRVKKIDYQGHPMQKTWHDHGYDTAWVPPNCRMVPSGQEEDCVWDPNRITIIETIKPKSDKGRKSRKSSSCFDCGGFPLHGGAGLMTEETVSVVLGPGGRGTELGPLTNKTSEGGPLGSRCTVPYQTCQLTCGGVVDCHLRM